jgi:5-methylcytosine-specific restriction protein A
MRTARLCGCGRIVMGKCPDCQRHRKASAEDYRPGSSDRYGSQWAGLSARYRAKHPLCEQCLAEGKTTPAIEVHHIRKVRDSPELVYEWSNLMSVCRSCHIRLDKSNG